MINSASTSRSAQLAFPRAPIYAQDLQHDATLRLQRTFNHAVPWMLVSGCVQHGDVARLVGALRLPAHLTREVLLDHVAAVCEFDARSIAALTCMVGQAGQG